MAHEVSIREKLISLLAHQPRHIINGMIRVTKQATFSSIKRSPKSTAPLGNLDVLPLELLHSIFSMLDLRTLSGITRTCLRGTVVVESLPEYRDLIRHAPQAMAALGSTRLLHYHSASTLHATLLSASCSSCGEYGAFLFLPTCERCCYECLWRNQSLWVIPISEARKCFDLSVASAKELPTMRSLPGKYYVRCSISRKRQLRLVSVRAAKELAIKENKSTEYLAHSLENRRTAGTPSMDYYMLRWLQAAPLQPPGPELAVRSSGGNVPNVPNDMFCGMASVLFPSLLAGNRVDKGLWCLGCEKNCREWYSNKSKEAGRRLAAPGGDVKHALYAMQSVARSEADFFDHIRHCPGAAELVPYLEEELRKMLHA